MAVHQRFIKRGMRSNPTAKRLIAASQNIAPVVIKTTLYDERISQQVQRCRAMQMMVVGKVVILPGQPFYMIRCELDPRRSYVMVRNVKTHEWQCSFPDMLKKLTPIVEAYIKELKTRKQEEQSEEQRRKDAEAFFMAATNDELPQSKKMNEEETADFFLSLGQEVA